MQAQTNCALTGCAMTGPFAGPSINGTTTNSVVNAALEPGADIGAKVSFAFAHCPRVCEVDIPASPSGGYRYSTPIRIPVGTLTTAWLKGQGAGVTQLIFTGTGDAIAALSLTGNAQSGLKISDLSVTCVGCAAGSNGLHLEGFNGGLVENIHVTGFPADCVFNQGENAVEFISDYWSSCLNGIHNKGVTIGGRDYSPNALHFIGGEVAYNTQYGVYEQATAGLPPNENNVYLGIDFEVNGTAAASNAQMFIQSADSDLIESNYMEPSPGSKGLASIVLGDSTDTANGTVVVGNFIGTDGSETVNDFNSLGTYVAGNTEDGVVKNFLLHGARSRNLTIGGGNSASSETGSFIAGVDDGADTLGFFPSSTFVNAIYSTPHGTGFNAVNSKAYYANGVVGFSGTKKAGNCVLTIASGIITGVSGC